MNMLQYENWYDFAQAMYCGSDKDKALIAHNLWVEMNYSTYIGKASQPIRNAIRLCFNDSSENATTWMKAIVSTLVKSGVDSLDLV